MQNHSSQREKYASFLNTYSDMDSSLIEAIVKQFGGVENFIEIHKDVIKEGVQTGFLGFIARKDILNLFAENKVNFTEFFAEEAQQFNMSCRNDFLRTLQNSPENECTDTDITEALNEPQNRTQENIIIRSVTATAETLCLEFANFLDMYDTDMAA